MAKQSDCCTVFAARFLEAMLISAAKGEASTKQMVVGAYAPVATKNVHYWQNVQSGIKWCLAHLEVYAKSHHPKAGCNGTPRAIVKRNTRKRRDKDSG